MAENINNSLDSPLVYNPVERGMIAISQEVLGLDLALRNDETNTHQGILKPIFGNGDIDETINEIVNSEKHRLAVQAPADRGWVSRQFENASEGVVHYGPEIGAGIGGAFVNPLAAGAVSGAVGGLKAGGKSIIDQLRENADLTDPASIKAVIENPELWSDIQDQAMIDSGLGAATWATLGGGGALAGKSLTAGAFKTAAAQNCATGVMADATIQLGQEGHSLARSVASCTLSAAVPIRVTGPGAAVLNNSGLYLGAPARAGELDTQIAELEDYLEQTNKGAPANPDGLGSANLDEIPVGALTTQQNNAVSSVTVITPEETKIENQPVPANINGGISNIITGFERGIMDFAMR